MHKLHIVNDLEPLGMRTTGREAQLLFQELTYSHFPVIENNRYLGCIAETDLRCFDAEKPLSDYQYAMERFFVRQNDNWLDVLESFAQNQTNILPVLDQNASYLGYYELQDTITLFNQTPFLSESGNILVVEKGVRDYSFSEISQIIETNNAKILGLFISSIQNDVAQITLKITDSDINSIAQTFRRYSYNVVLSHQDDVFLNNLKERSDYLKRYLNI